MDKQTEVDIERVREQYTSGDDLLQLLAEVAQGAGTNAGDTDLDCTDMMLVVCAQAIGLRYTRHWHNPGLPDAYEVRGPALFVACDAIAALVLHAQGHHELARPRETPWATAVTVRAELDDLDETGLKAAQDLLHAGIAPHDLPHIVRGVISPPLHSSTATTR